MDVRMISGAAYSRPPLAVTGLAPVTLDNAKATPNSAPYLSPVFHFDSQAHVTILSYRDPNNGNVTTQIPSEHVVEQYRRANSHEARSSAGTGSVESGKTSGRNESFASSGNAGNTPGKKAYTSEASAPVSAGVAPAVTSAPAPVPAQTSAPAQSEAVPAQSSGSAGANPVSLKV